MVGFFDGVWDEAAGEIPGGATKRLLAISSSSANKDLHLLKGHLFAAASEDIKVLVILGELYTIVANSPSRPLTYSESRDRGVDNMPAFIASNNLKPFVSNELIASTTPVWFQTPSAGEGFGYRAILLPQVCSVYLSARDANALLPSQRHIAELGCIQEKS